MMICLYSKIFTVWLINFTLPTCGLVSYSGAALVTRRTSALQIRFSLAVLFINLSPLTSTWWFVSILRSSWLINFNLPTCGLVSYSGAALMTRRTSALQIRFSLAVIFINLSPLTSTWWFVSILRSSLAAHQEKNRVQDSAFDFHMNARMCSSIFEGTVCQLAQYEDSKIKH